MSNRPPTNDEMVERFDQIEANWLKYKDAMCSLAFDRYRDGTIAPSVGTRGELQMMRGHMRELGGILGDNLHR